MKGKDDMREVIVKVLMNLTPFYLLICVVVLESLICCAFITEETT